MSENSYKSIRNGAIASIIAGIVLLAIPVLRGYVVSIFSLFYSGIIWCWKSLCASYSLPGWAWLLVFLLAFIGIGNIYFGIKSQSKKPEYIEYVEDFIHSAKWRWSWIGNKISNLWCYCPHCDAMLVYNDSSCRNYLTNPQTDFMCENCGNTVIASISGGDKDYAIGAVKREIDRRIRTGEYNKTQH